MSTKANMNDIKGFMLDEMDFTVYLRYSQYLVCITEDDEMAKTRVLELAPMAARIVTKEFVDESSDGYAYLDPKELAELLMKLSSK